MKSFRSTLILLGVFGVLLAWYLGYEKKFKVDSKKTEEKSKLLVSLDKDAIQEVEVYKLKKTDKPDAKPEYTTLKLRKSDKDWLIVAPIEYKADSTAVNGILTAIATTKQDRTVDEKPASLEAFGLTTPDTKIVVRKDSATPAEEIHIGGDTPVEFFAYAKVAGKDPVYKVTRSLKTSVDKPVKDLRNKEIVHISRDEIAEAEIHNSKGNFVIKKSAPNTWVLARENLPADTTEWNRSIDPLIQLRAIDFASEKGDNLAAFGLQKPIARVTLTKESDKSRVTVLIGKTKDKTYAKREDKPTVFEVDKTITDKIDKPASAFRNLKVADFNRFDVKRIKIERAKEPLELVKDNTDWLLTEGNRKANALEVDKFLSALQDSKISNYSPQKPTGNLKGLVIHLFEKKDGTESEKVVLSFADPKGTEVLVERKGLSQPFFIKKDDFQKLNLSKEALLKEEKKEEKKG